jgi:hypothetical protein
MNCRKFERNLEDYLQGGLDFAARFGMERHARQCVLCGKEMADAQRLSQMSRELERVKAPSDFESSVLREIAKRRSQGVVPFVRRFWIYGIEWHSWQKPALAALSLTILGIGAFYLSRPPVPGGAPVTSLVPDRPVIVHSESNPGTNSRPVALKPPVPDRIPNPSLVANRPASGDPENDPGTNSRPVALRPRRTGQVFEMTATPESPGAVQRTIVPDLESSEVEYVEHILPGLDNRPMTIRLPKAIRVQYGQTSEEYFIRNVSH